MSQGQVPAASAGQTGLRKRANSMPSSNLVCYSQVLC